ncbi:MAG: 50S ribosomal protein L27 [Candidatus Omnitrophica bacterium]|nr:50S ribosomal protein L27 [Candidatus Omnitrophota bacterium]
MVGGKSRPKKDRTLKVSAGQEVGVGQILVRNLGNYKAGLNVKGQSTLYALASGKVYFTKKKASSGKVHTFVNILPIAKNAK